ncbi:hypothetical protein FO519_000799 [Halicephalobus sp. NKZ332]|nr:hypothetical protein FO519_000799 [Halicephalobus sp. NKZ332]
MMDGTMKRQIFGFLFVFFFLIAVNVESKPTNGMTRIQEVLRTLMGNKPGLSARGKKFYNAPESQFYSSFHEPMEIKALLNEW